MGNNIRGTEIPKMRNIFLLGLTVMILFISVATAVVWADQSAEAEAVISAFENFAVNISYFGPDEFIYGFRENRLRPVIDKMAFGEFTEYLGQGTWSGEDFLPLLKHSDPKVRTLALIALYNLEDSKLLPEIFPLVNDEAETFSSIRLTAAPALATDNELGSELIEPQTVGAIATKILNVYLEHAGYFYGPQGINGQPGFEEYWKDRAERQSCASWWTVRLLRASHSTNPTPQESFTPIRSLRSQIDKLHEPDRTYTLLWLNGESGSDVLISQNELIRLLQNLGAHPLLHVLQRKIESDDPDLQPRLMNNYSYQRMCLFILEEARAFLRPADAKALLVQEEWERDYQIHGISDPLISPLWAIAAAQLNVREADSILKEAHARFSSEFDGDNRLELTKALWSFVGEREILTVVDWFYREMAKPPSTTWAMSITLEALLKTPGRDHHLLVKTLMDDARFENINWKSLEVLVNTINAWSGEDLVPKQELETVKPPTGSIDFFSSDIPQAMREHPKETTAFLDKLAEWRRALWENFENVR